ncbi:hypothetical protein CHS0354_041236 [Potamilus streckersoni]|uniref:Ankyrin repeat domain-containing protein 55 n=1 Tax=Potamilus streckersoni TaxID=2493646 RepID=A0AAE0SDU7_9BIVA|nr:hypothetical protein CHS0354_041236 [Potamilus streckersoni]
MDFPEADSDNDVDCISAHRAAAVGDIPLLVKAIQLDPTVLEQLDEDGYTPLSHAVQSEHLQTVKQLVKMGANINTQDKDGRTYMSLAAYQGWNEGVVYLLRHGARQSICDKFGRTPLQAATYNENPSSLETLLQNLTVDQVNQTDNEKMTALHWAAFHNRPTHVRRLLECGANVMKQDIDGKTALHWAAQNGSKGCCSLFLTHKMRWEILHGKDNMGKTAVHFAAAAGHADILSEMSKLDSTVIDAEDIDDRTPLHWAAAMGHTDCVRSLLKLGANPDVQDVDGATPMVYAKQSKYADIQRLLEEALRKQEIHKQNNTPSPSKNKTSSGGLFSSLFSSKERRDKRLLKSDDSTSTVSGSGTSQSPIPCDSDKQTPKSNRGLFHLENINLHKNNKFHGQGAVPIIEIDERLLAPGAEQGKKKKKHKQDKFKELLGPKSKKVSHFDERPPQVNNNKQKRALTTGNPLTSLHLSSVQTLDSDNITPSEAHSPRTQKKSREMSPLVPISPLEELSVSPRILPHRLEALRSDDDQRSPTPPPYLPLNVTAKKVLPGISLLAKTDSVMEEKKRKKKKKKKQRTDEISELNYLTQEPIVASPYIKSSAT